MRTRFLQYLALVICSAYTCSLTAAQAQPDQFQRVVQKKNLGAKEGFEALKQEVQRRVNTPQNKNHDHSSSTTSCPCPSSSSTGCPSSTTGCPSSTTDCHPTTSTASSTTTCQPTSTSSSSSCGCPSSTSGCGCPSSTSWGTFNCSSSTSGCATSTCGCDSSSSSSSSSSDSHSSRSQESCVCDETRIIKKLPYTIRKPGKYRLDKDLCFDCNGCGIGIKVRANDVFIEGDNHTINLRDGNGTAILIDKFITGVTIANLKIANSGFPGIVQETVPSVGQDYVGLLCLPAAGPFNCNAPCSTTACPAGGDYDFCGDTSEGKISFHCPANPAFDMNFAVIQARDILANAYQNPFIVNNPYSAVGIGLSQSSQNIWISNVIFDHLFLGIAAPQAVNNILVTDCVAFECGYEFPSVEQDVVEGVHRGGFACFSTFGGDHTTNVTMKNCLAYTTVGAFGTFFANAQNVSLEDCVMAINTIETASDWAKTASVISALFSQDIVVRNCYGFGSESPFNFEAVDGVTVLDAIAKYWTDTGINFAFSKFGDFRNCNVSDSNSPAAIAHFDTQQAIGFNALLSTDVIVLDTVARNLQQIPTEPFGAQSIGFNMLADRIKLKNNIAEYCMNAGFLFGYVKDAMVEDCQALANGRFPPDCLNGHVPNGGAGFVFLAPGCFLKPARTLFIRNVAVGNGANYRTNYVDHSGQHVFGKIVDLSNCHHHDDHHISPYANIEKTQ